MALVCLEASVRAGALLRIDANSIQENSFIRHVSNSGASLVAGKGILEFFLYILFLSFTLSLAGCALPWLAAVGGCGRLRSGNQRRLQQIVTDSHADCGRHYQRAFSFSFKLSPSSCILSATASVRTATAKIVTNIAACCHLHVDSCIINLPVLRVVSLSLRCPSHSFQFSLPLLSSCFSQSHTF